MKLEFTPYPNQDEAEQPPDGRRHEGQGADGVSKRVDPRCEVGAQAFVTVTTLPPRAYDIGEISRGGMFLGFKDARSTALELERAGVEPGTYIDIAFAVTLPDDCHRFSVRARISRITQQGIGVQFTTRNPPQLAALRDLFSAAVDQHPPTVESDPAPAAGERPEKRIVKKPDESNAWKDWELLD